jgi:hypothetical protein
MNPEWNWRSGIIRLHRRSIARKKLQPREGMRHPPDGLDYALAVPEVVQNIKDNGVK